MHHPFGLLSAQIVRLPSSRRLTAWKMSVNGMVVWGCLRVDLLDMGEMALALYRSVLNRIGWGIVVLGPSGTVVYANAAAQKYIDSGEISVAPDGTLKSAMGKDPPALGILAQLASERSSAGYVTAFSAERGENVEALDIVVAPISAGRPDDAGSQRRPFMLLISDPRADLSFPGELLQNLYGLTVGEARVAVELAQGRSVNEIVENRGRTSNTIRTQVKSAMIKMGAKRQSDLVRIVLNLPQTWPPPTH
jgi:DNA-binding CsgD family transcriptional regulator